MSDIDAIVNKGRNAEHLLNDPTLNEALEEMLSECSLGWLATAQGDFERRDELYLRAQAIKDLRGKLQGWLNSAQMEAAKLQKQQRRK